MALGADQGRAGSATLNRIIHRYSETHGTLQWTFGGPMRGLSPGRRRPRRDLLPEPRRGDDRGLFRADLGDAAADRAGRRAGRARIITAAKSDNHATISAARYTYKRLLRRGVEIFEYQPTKLHTKLVILDDVVHIGSSNFDIRSLYLNLEMMLRVDDPEFATLMRAYFEQELRRHATPITPSGARASARRWFNRIVWALSFFLVTSADYTRHPPAQLRQRGRASRPLALRARARPRTGSRAAR